MIRVLIADDHAPLRKYVWSYLSHYDDIQVVGTAADGRTAVDQTLELRPDVVLMDVSMPSVDGLVATRLIREIDKKISILVMSMFAEGRLVQEALGCGANGFVAKEDLVHAVVPGIRTVFGGRPFFSPTVTRVLSKKPVERFRESEKC